MSEHVLTAISERVLAIRLNRPEKKNALTQAMYEALCAALDAADKDPAIRAITITGSGDSFSSGNDLADFLAQPPADDASPVMRFLATIARAAKPIVAGVNGLAVGIGATMLLHCDLVYAAAESGSFQLPFVNLGLVPEAASTLLLPRLAGYHRAAELMLLGERFDARVAQEIGLVNAIIPATELDAHVRARAAALAAKPPAALRLAKALLKGDGAAVAARMAEESAHFMRQLRSPEAREAMAAFMEKRKPDFSRFD
jgi:enoyl-CoA hydratase/carnithine racemase